jgi:CxxC-x17-CxxC domain-containing protein
MKPPPFKKNFVGGTNKQKEGEILPMMSNEGYQDRILICRDCGQDFTFSAGEQEFYASRGLTNTPGRCPSCRAARRGRPSSSTHTPRSSSEHYQTTCATCGRPTSVPFIPREDRPVYCNDCFQAQRASRSSRRDDSRSSYSTSDYSSNYSSGRGNRDRRDRRDHRHSDW